MKPVSDYYQFLKIDWKTVMTERLRGNKDRESVALMLPEGTVIHEPLRWFQQLLNLNCTKAGAEQLPFGFHQ